jgi:hypothetical protein
LAILDLLSQIPTKLGLRPGAQLFVDSADELDRPVDPHRLLQLAAGGKPLLEYVAEDLARFQSSENARLMTGLLGALVVYASSFDGLKIMYDSGNSFAQVCQLAAGVEPKEYPPGVPIDGISYVIRGTARITNCLRKSDWERAHHISDLIAWQPMRRILLASVYAICMRSRQYEIARHIIDDLGLAEEVTECSLSGGHSKHNTGRDAQIRAAIEKELVHMFPYGASFAFSGGPINPQVRYVDAKRKTADIHLGVCRFTEGADVGGSVKNRIERFVPGIKNARISCSEL